MQPVVIRRPRVVVRSEFQVSADKDRVCATTGSFEQPAILFSGTDRNGQAHRFVARELLRGVDHWRTSYARPAVPDKVVIGIAFKIVGDYDRRIIPDAGIVRIFGSNPNLTKHRAGQSYKESCQFSHGRT